MLYIYFSLYMSTNQLEIDRVCLRYQNNIKGILTCEKQINEMYYEKMGEHRTKEMILGHELK